MPIVQLGDYHEGRERLARVDSSGALKSIPTEHSNIHHGYAFNFWHIETLVDDEVKYLHISTGSLEVHLKEVDIQAEGEDTLVCFFHKLDVALSATPEQRKVHNSNENSTRIPELKVYLNSTATGEEEDKCWRRWYLFGSEGVGQRSGSSAVGTNWEKILAPNSDYILRFQRPGKTGTFKVAIEARGYERAV